MASTGGAGARDPLRGAVARLRQRLFGGANKGQPMPAASAASFDENDLRAVVAELRANAAMPLPFRLRIVKDLCEVVGQYRLETDELIPMWTAVQDLLAEDLPPEATQTIFQFMTVLAETQNERLGQLRGTFFAAVETQRVRDADLPLQLALLVRLTQNGRDASSFELKVGPLLLLWRSPMSRLGHIREFLVLVGNFVRFNMAFLEAECVAGLIRYACLVCTSGHEVENVGAGLDVLDVIVRYGFIPSSCLSALVRVLCRTLNVEQFCDTSWRTMRNILKGPLGHTTIRAMCDILEDPNNKGSTAADPNNKGNTAVGLLRGAVFYIGMATWGAQRIPNLKQPVLSVLPSFLSALASQHPIVAYEVALSLSRLVKKFGMDLPCPHWELIMDVLEAVRACLPRSAFEDGSPESSSLLQVMDKVVETIEDYYVQQRYNGTSRRLFDLLEAYKHRRPESSVILLLNYKASQLHPATDGWLANMRAFLDAYLRRETRRHVRLKALSVLASVAAKARHTYLDELLSEAIPDYLENLPSERDPAVRQMGIELLVDIAVDCSARHFVPVLHLIHRSAFPPPPPAEGVPAGEVPAAAAPHVTEEPKSPLPEKDADSAAWAAFTGLVAVFRNKLMHLPTSQALVPFNLLIQGLREHYLHLPDTRAAKGDVSKAAGTPVDKLDKGTAPAAAAAAHPRALSSRVRLTLFAFLLRIRAHADGHVSAPSGGAQGEALVSPHLTCGCAPVPGVRDRALARLTSPSEQAPSPLSASASGGPPSPTTPVSEMEGTGSVGDSADGSAADASLAMEDVLSVVVECLRKETDWDIYALVLRELPGMLLCSRLFAGVPAAPFVGLASTLTTKMSQGALADTVVAVPTGRSRSELHVHAARVLTALAAYRQHLTQAQQEDVIMCLDAGLTSKSDDVARLSAHGLIVCLGDLHAAMRRRIREVLERLMRSTIPSRAGMSVLGFLLCVVRVPSLHEKHVTDDKYNMLPFGIALQFVAADRPSKAPPHLAALALQVINVWFLRCRLQDRRKYARYIVKGLVQHPKESHAPPRDLDEDTEVCIDLLSRHAYGNCAGVPDRTPIADVLLRMSVSQSWIVGSGVVTIRTSPTGWAEVVVRRATGVASFIVRPQNKQFLEEDLYTGGVSAVAAEAGFQGDSDGTLSPAALQQQLALIADRERERTWARSAGPSPRVAPVPDAAVVARHGVPPPIAPASAPVAAALQSHPPAAQGTTAHESDDSHVTTREARDAAEGRGDGEESEGRTQRKTSGQAQHRPSVSVSTPPLETKSRAASFSAAEPRMLPSVDGHRSAIPTDASQNAVSAHAAPAPETPLSSDPITVPSSAIDAMVLARAPSTDKPHRAHAKLSREVSLMAGAGGVALIESLGLASLPDCTPPRHGALDVIELLSSPPRDGEAVDLRASLSAFSDASSSSPGNGARRELGEGRKESATDLLESPPSSALIGTSPLSYAPLLSYEDEDDTVSGKDGRRRDRKSSRGAPDVVGVAAAAYPPVSTPKLFVDEGAAGVARAAQQWDSGLDSFVLDAIDGRGDGHSATPAAAPRLSHGHAHHVHARVPGAPTSIWPSDASPAPANSGASHAPSHDNNTHVSSSHAPHAHSEHSPSHAPPPTLSHAGASSSSLGAAAPAFAIPPSHAHRHSDPFRSSRTGSPAESPQQPSSPTRKLSRRDLASDSAAPSGNGALGALSSLSAPASGGVGAAGGNAAQSSFLQGVLAANAGGAAGAFPSSVPYSVYPSHILLQLTHFAGVSERPMLLKRGEGADRALSVLDRLPACETHKIGVIYVGPSQTAEAEILSNDGGTLRYLAMLQGMGRLLRLRGASEYTGGLDRVDDSDGAFAFAWQDDTTQVIYHVATMMPNRESDIHRNSKKLHIGNDYVTVVYDDSSRGYAFGTVKGQFNFVEVVVRPVDDVTNEVFVQTSEAMQEFVPFSEPVLISNDYVGEYVRQIALQANLASQVSQAGLSQSEHSTNWKERLRQIKRMRARLCETAAGDSKGQAGAPLEPVCAADFTDFAV